MVKRERESEGEREREIERVHKNKRERDSLSTPLSTQPPLAVFLVPNQCFIMPRCCACARLWGSTREHKRPSRGQRATEEGTPRHASTAGPQETDPLNTQLLYMITETPACTLWSCWWAYACMVVCVCVCVCVCIHVWVGLCCDAHPCI